MVYKFHKLLKFVTFKYFHFNIIFNIFQDFILFSKYKCRDKGLVRGIHC